MRRKWRVFLVGALIAAATLAVAAWLMLSEEALLKHLAGVREHQCRACPIPQGHAGWNRHS